MAGLLDLLNSPMGQQLISGVAGQTNQPEDKTANVLSMAMPLILGAMKKNVSTPEGAQGLMSALSSKHSGGILDNLGGLFGGGVDDSVMSDGAGILGHVFGNKQPQVESALSAKSGLDAGSVAQILKIAAPIVMGFLGKQTAQSNVSDSNGMNALLGSMLGGQPQENQSLITTLLDADGDGSILDDVAGMVMGSNKKQGGLGGLLGGLFGK
ncbi:MULTISPECIES: DUF937 domain-containing protein [Maribacter]|jgi:hypothetical protein|uniref:DUF937 domain-containing protein n=1 Tax=Maribacter stanieri TaxID=440514 RepID=A0A1I6K006_9FLAO|nr:MULTISPECIES: DUF937 domain-containing protein [Maribacter]SFR84563.1 hypothetical protein SAMN04488010_3308 [Maribacter stanieri]|tara:strand:- start:623 stop:1255 length:633 start_codon:yes stop_codon:yes gene_type:complete|eukprot:TRINITY_DN12322_c0_g1_i1.p1 TRINITY_DN12322_c0_g1~~TRINITY_DN12322_c0_g1_i1.p1  ORF type:complete len:211 (-),score=64.91 TRINITY_DN12322_c0_g1_i1:460-1092(-)